MYTRKEKIKIHVRYGWAKLRQKIRPIVSNVKLRLKLIGTTLSTKLIDLRTKIHDRTSDKLLDQIIQSRLEILKLRMKLADLNVIRLDILGLLKI